MIVWLCVSVVAAVSPLVPTRLTVPDCRVKCYWETKHDCVFASRYLQYTRALNTEQNESYCMYIVFSTDRSTVCFALSINWERNYNLSPVSLSTRSKRHSLLRSHSSSFSRDRSNKYNCILEINITIHILHSHVQCVGTCHYATSVSTMKKGNNNDGYIYYDTSDKSSDHISRYYVQEVTIYFKTRFTLGSN